MDKLEIAASTDNFDTVLAFVEEHLDAAGCPADVKVQLDIAVEEIFVNIASYAYGDKEGYAEIDLTIDENPPGVTITFADSGTPYNPLAKPDPDITLSAEERGIGGLGIYMVKQSMDEVTYEHKDGKNMLTIKKKFES